jgi:adenylate cyclase
MKETVGARRGDGRALNLQGASPQVFLNFARTYLNPVAKVQRISLSDGERRLAAIMFTDIVGYTHLSQDNESLAVELLEEHRGILRPVFLAHGGTEVKTIGDAFLVEFKSALEAVLCAAEMQKKMAQRNAETVPSRRLELRIGIHVGDVIHGQGDIYGDAVNVASRIESLAEPGGVCISQQVFDQIRNKTQFSIDKLGEVELKNVDLPMTLYRVTLVGNRASVGANHSGPRDRLAVLPFVNISPDKNDEYFADGLTEELIAKLSEVKGLKVIARTSVMNYRKKEKNVSEIAAELQVGSIIEGSVRKAGDRIRISVQLIDPRTQEHIWSSNYDSKLDDIFAIQSDVASKVATSLSAEFFSQDARKDTESIEAYTLYLRAMQLSYDTNEASTRETLTLFQRAVAKDPGYARAYAGLADAWRMRGGIGHEDFVLATRNAEAAALRALELDPKLAEAHSAMAGVHSMLDRFDAELVEAEAAVRINPNLSEAYVSLGVVASIMGSPLKALLMFKRAYELDPLSFGASEALATSATWAGDDGLASDILARMREFNPKEPKAYLCTADYYMERRDFAEAQKMIDAARDVGPGEPMIPVSQGLLFALTGKRKQAEDALKEMAASGNEPSILRGELFIQAALGNLDEAFRVLMRQAETHSWPFSIKIDPFYAEMRKDPRFLDFCRKVGIKP